MFILKSDRIQLLDFIQNPKIDALKEINEDNLELYTELYEDEMYLIWSHKPCLEIYLPECICVSRGKVKEFLAWSSTYLRSTFFPITAFCHVIDTNELELLRKINVNQIDNKVKGAILGAVIGETINLFENSEIKHINILAAKSTFSYILSKAYILGLSINDKHLSESYKNIYSILSTRNQTMVNSIQVIWHILILSFQEKLPKVNKYEPYSSELILLADSIKDIFKKGKIAQKNLTKLIKLLPNSTFVNLEGIDHRESRLIEFEKFVESLDIKQCSPLVASFICAYLINNIAPGTFEHNNIVKQYIRVFPDLYIWYAILAGISSNSVVLNYNNGFGNRIMRDLFKMDSIFHRPQADISINELEILMNVPSFKLSNISESQTYLAIELFPTIDSIIALMPSLKGNNDVKNNRQDKDVDFISKNSILESEQKLKNEVLDKLGQTIIDSVSLFEKYTGKKIELQSEVSRK